MQSLGLVFVKSSLINRFSLFLFLPELLDLQFHTKNLMNIWYHRLDHQGSKYIIYYLVLPILIFIYIIDTYKMDIL